MLFLIGISFIEGQIISGFTSQGFTVSAFTDIGLHNTFFLNYNFSAADQPTTLYTLKLISIFEALPTGVNGRLTPIVGSNIPITSLTMNPPSHMNTTTSINMTMSFTGTTPAVPLTSLKLDHIFWLPGSGKTACPDVNGRFCMKVIKTFTYNLQNPQASLVFHWQLLENQIMSLTMNPNLVTSHQVLNNLAFYSLETMATGTNNQLIPTPLTVTLELRTDNLTTNGIWVVYPLSTLNKPPYSIVHDPVVGINAPTATLSIQIVTAALSAALVLAFLVILSCSIYIYHGNTKDYYIKLRIRQELQ